jgi:L-rhamnose mutarotase
MKMERVAFTMKLKKDCAAEYKRRHDAIWPELARMLKGIGIQQYSIFLDDSTNTLFGYMQFQDPGLIEKLRGEPLMWKWWNYMADIMDINPDQSPKSISLREVFFLP